MIDNDSLYLYHLTLKGSSFSTISLIGHFLGEKKSQELLIIGNVTLDLYRINFENGELENICHQQTIGVIQCASKMQISNEIQEHVLVSSDSGKMILMKYDLNVNEFVPEIQEPVSKNGFTRFSPIEYLSVDVENNTILLSAIERNKVIYKITVGNDGKLNLSPPIEEISKNTLCLKTTSSHNILGCPTFASIEMVCENKSLTLINDPLNFFISLTYYQLDPGLNHIKKKIKSDIFKDSNYLFAMPEKIGGILLFCGTCIIYDHPDETIKRHYIPMILRNGHSKTVIVNHVLHKMKKDQFFILVQSSCGDLLKITIKYDFNREKLIFIGISYFDTIPVSTDIGIFKKGFLFANVINSDKLIYQIDSLGVEETDLIIKSIDFPDVESINIFDDNSKYFTPSNLKNLSFFTKIESLCPLVDSCLLDNSFFDTNDNLNRLLLISSNPYLNTINYGVNAYISVSSSLLFNVSDIFTTKIFSDTQNDEYLILSSVTESKTIVLKIDEVMEKIDNSGLDLNQATISVGQFGTSSIVQVFATGLKHIKHMKIKSNDKINEFEMKIKVTDWNTPSGVTILTSCINNTQVILGMSNSEMIYFEIDSNDDQLIEYEDKIKFENTTIKCIGLLTSNNLKSPYTVVGCSDESLHVISLNPQNFLKKLSFQSLRSNVSSLLILLHENIMYVHVGLMNGIYTRVKLDSYNGQLSDSKIKYIGSNPVSLVKMKISDKFDSVLIKSSQLWVCFYKKKKFILNPILNINVSNATPFFSETLGCNGIAGIQENNLIIFTIDDKLLSFGESLFNVDKIKLRYHPRKMIVEKESKKFPVFLYILESQNHCESFYSKKDVFNTINSNLQEDNDNEDIDEIIPFDENKVQLKENNMASCIEVIDYSKQKLIQVVEFSNQEKLVSITKVNFASSKKGKSFIVVGVTIIPNHKDKFLEENFLYTFSVHKNVKTKKINLIYIHKTKIKKSSFALLSFNRMLLVGIENCLYLYDLGQKQLLRKSSSTIDYMVNITKIIHIGGDRIAVADSNNSVSFVKFNITENKFFSFADDIMKRQIVSLVLLDLDTIMGSDKFGNVFVLRLPKNVSDEIDNNWIVLKNHDYLNASGFRLNIICEFYLGDISTSLIKGSLYMGGEEAIIYIGLSGSIGIFIPILSKKDVEFLVKLELLMRECITSQFDDFDKNKNSYNLLGKDHVKFRSYYNPVKNVIDGDLLEKFYYLDQSLKVKISLELNRSYYEIERKLYYLRSNSAL